MSDLDLAVEANPTLDLVNALQGGNFNSAEELFNDILGDKMQQSLDAEKVSVADHIFNGVEPVEMEIDDEEVDAILDTVSEDE
tara:strand:+ start:125 stop:373 length:249 start_codon:yes stop_codon:yes gene_type:complete